MEVFSYENLVAFWNAIFWQEENVSTWIIAKWAILGCCLANFYMLWRHRETLYSIDNGFGIRTKQDPHTIPPWPRLCMFDWLPESPKTITFVLGSGILACVAAIVGVGGVIPLAWMYLVDTSRTHRNLMCNHAGDTYMRLMLFLMVLAYALNPMADVGGLSYYLTNGNMGIDESWAPWPLRLMMVMWISCYVNAGMHKLKGVMWRDGTAAFYPLYCHGFKRFPVPQFLLGPPLVKMATWGTIALECGALLAIFPELRFEIVWLIVIMHLVFDYTLNIQLFGWIMISVCTVWIWPDTAHEILQSIGLGQEVLTQ